MDTLPLSAGGPPVSPIVAGCWRLAEWQWSPEQTAGWIAQCLDLGITTFDHADIYGDYGVEALFGAALAHAAHLRERIRIVTKCGIRLVSPARPGHRVKSYDSSGAHIVASAEASLCALRTDRIDLLLLHRPDPLMEPAEQPARRVQWVLGEIGARLGVSPATVAYAWASRHPSRPVVLVGSRRMEAMREATEAAALTLSREDWTALWQAGAGHEVA